MTLLPCSLERLNTVISWCLILHKRARHILAELLDLLDLGGQVVGEGVLQGLDNQIKLAFRTSLVESEEHHTLVLAEE